MAGKSDRFISEHVTDIFEHVIKLVMSNDGLFSDKNYEISAKNY